MNMLFCITLVAIIQLLSTTEKAKHTQVFNTPAMIAFFAFSQRLPRLLDVKMEDYAQQE